MRGRRFLRLAARYLRGLRWMAVVLGLLIFAGIGFELAAPLLLSRYVNDAEVNSPLNVLAAVAVLFIVLTTSGRVVTVIAGYLTEQLGWRMSNSMRLDLADHCLHLDMPFHAAHSPGELLERVDGDVTALSTSLPNFVFSVVGRGLLSIGIIVVAFILDVWFGVVFVIFALLLIAGSRPLQRRSVPRQHAYRQANAHLSAVLEEGFTGKEDLRANGAAEYFTRKLNAALDGFVRTRRSSAVGGRIFSSALEAGVAFASAAVLGVGAALLVRGETTLGIILAGYFYTLLLAQALSVLTLQVDTMQGAFACVQRIGGLLATPRLIDDGSGPALPEGMLAVTFDHVHSGYADGPDVLHDICLTIAAGTKTGLVGRTGSGKTSMARLICRQHDVRSGVVAINGRDVRELKLADLRSRIAVVTQAVDIFDASVRDNITLFDQAISDDLVMAALSGLGLGAWVATLPEGLDTRLSGGGSGLSGGEGQMLAFARAFLRDPDIVILDEASSRIDAATEQLISRAVERLLEGRTALIIAHRLKTLDIVDQIVVLDDGQVVECGPRGELAQLVQSRYSALLAEALA